MSRWHRISENILLFKNVITSYQELMTGNPKNAIKDKFNMSVPAIYNAIMVINVPPTKLNAATPAKSVRWPIRKSPLTNNNPPTK
jgi:hypothetical protein